VVLTPHPLRGHERIELYLYPPSRPVQACNGRVLDTQTTSKRTKFNMDDKIEIVLKNDMRILTGFSGVIITKTGRPL
jgi:hypothetical protein